MTKVTILNQKPKEEKELKPIEFKYYIHYKGGELCNDSDLNKPSYYDEIEVIKRTNRLEYDIFLCYKGNIRSTYIGNLNDGIVL